MKKLRIIAIGAAALTALTVLAVGGCSKFTEPYKDAPVLSRDDTGAEVYTMPDGFSNFASKCDKHGNRVYVAFKGDANRAAIAVIQADSSCMGK